MVQSQVYMVNIAEGETIDIKTLDANDINYNYTISTIIFLGATTNVTTIELDGIPVSFPGGCVFNQSVIKNITAITASEGVLLIGKKTRKTIFQPVLDPNDLQNDYLLDYVDDYFQ